jgi:hypothetical protein
MRFTQQVFPSLVARPMVTIFHAVDSYRLLYTGTWRTEAHKR